MDGNEHDNHHFVKFFPNVRDIVCEQLLTRSQEKNFAVMELNRKIESANEILGRSCLQWKVCEDLKHEVTRIATHSEQLNSFLEGKTRPEKSWESIVWLLSPSSFDFRILEQQFNELFIQHEKSTQTEREFSIDSKLDYSNIPKNGTPAEHEFGRIGQLDRFAHRSRSQNPMNDNTLLPSTSADYNMVNPYNQTSPFPQTSGVVTQHNYHYQSNVNLITLKSIGAMHTKMG